MIRRLVTLGPLIALLLVTALAATASSPRTATVVGPTEPAAFFAGGGPIVLMGIDPEDGGHGPISVYVNIVNNLLSDVTNGGSGLLVIGGGKFPTDSVTRFWNSIAAMTGQAVTYVNGDTAIRTQSFAGFALIVVVTSVFEVSGGLTQSENDALGIRKSDVASFVNSGGGILGFTQSRLMFPYDYIAAFGGITVANLTYSQITPTAEGLSLGITNQLDVSFWHEEYLAFPGFLRVLATNDETGNPAAVGGRRIMVPPPVFCCTDDNDGNTFSWNIMGEFVIRIGNEVFTGTGIVQNGEACGRGPVFPGLVPPGQGGGRGPVCITCFSGSYINSAGRRVQVQARKDICTEECIVISVVQLTISAGRTITDTPGVGPDCPF